MKKKIFLLIILMLSYNIVYAQEGEITDNCKITIGDKSYSKINDTRYTTYENFNKEDIINISCDENITHIYIYYDKKSTKGSISDIKIGQNGYLHELIKLDGKSNNVAIKYDDDYSISEIFLFNTVKLPDWVEDWQKLDKADLMLFSTHGDDEQLFFAGLMPTYIDRGKKIQVVYFANHFNNTNRYHEQLEGLWTIGIKYYPVFSEFPDAYSESLEGALTNLNKSGYTREDALKYEVEQIRKYKPLVVVGHDINGEYGHGQHILNTDILKDAIIEANNSDFDKESFEKHGSWNIKKLYLHLYDQNKIVLDYDIPLSHYDGKTAYEISKLGYAKHYSQQYTWFTAWLNGDNNEYKTAKEIEKYNPAYYGLYYSSVGEDKELNDMFENIVKEDKNINIIESSKKAIIDFKKEIKNNNIPGIIGCTLICIAFLGVIIIKNRVKHK